MNIGSSLLVLVGLGAPLGAMEQQPRTRQASSFAFTAQAVLSPARLAQPQASSRGQAAPVRSMASVLWNAGMDRRAKLPPLETPAASVAVSRVAGSRPAVRPFSPLPGAARAVLAAPPAPGPAGPRPGELAASLSMIALECKGGSPSVLVEKGPPAPRETKEEVYLPDEDGWIDLGERPAVEGAGTATFKLALKGAGPTVTLFNSRRETLSLHWEDPAVAAGSLALVGPWPAVPGGALRPWGPQESQVLTREQGVRVRPGGKGSLALVVRSADAAVHARVLLECLD